MAGDEQYTREKASRIFAANITLAKPEFEQNKKYLMTLESRGRVIASERDDIEAAAANRPRNPDATPQDR